MTTTQTAPTMTKTPGTMLDILRAIEQSKKAPRQPRQLAEYKVVTWTVDGDEYTTITVRGMAAVDGAIKASFASPIVASVTAYDASGKCVRDRSRKAVR